MATYKTGSWGSSRSTSRTSTRTTTRRPAPGYQSVCNSFTNKISSYKQLTSQAMGPARKSRPSPASLNSFSKWIEKGAVVQKVSATQLRKWSSSKQAFKSTASAKSCMEHRFGKGAIKAVIPNKTGGFLVATASTWKGKSFHFPK